MPSAVCVKVEDSFYKVISEISARTFVALLFFSFQIIKENTRSWVGGQGDINVSYWSGTVVIFFCLYIEPPSVVLSA
jgi:hypothetical protein